MHSKALKNNIYNESRSGFDQHQNELMHKTQMHTNILD